MGFGFKKLTLQVETADGADFTLLEDLIYVRPDGKILRNRSGSSTDGMSDPKWLEAFKIVQNLSRRAFLPSVMHDGGFRGTLDTLTPEGRWIPLPLEFMDEAWCNALIKECMESVGISHAESKAVFIILQAAGFRAFTDDRKNLQ